MACEREKRDGTGKKWVVFCHSHLLSCIPSSGKKYERPRANNYQHELNSFLKALEAQTPSQKVPRTI